jgi:aconitate hydratase
VRSFNRNFQGRSGTTDAQVYLASAEVCAATALRGALTDPRELGEMPVVTMPQAYVLNDNMVIAPPADASQVEVVRGPNIKPLPTRGPLDDTLQGELLLVMGDNITTDHILPAGAKILPLRSNIPAISEYAFTRVDPTFPERAKAAGSGFVLGGENYGQGSSREHAALAPMYLGVRAVLAKSFARIHQANLINFGILPLVFARPEDAERLKQGDVLRLPEVRARLSAGQLVTVVDVTQGIEIPMTYDLSERQIEIILAGGLLNYIQATA